MKFTMSYRVSDRRKAAPSNSLAPHRYNHAPVARPNRTQCILVVLELNFNPTG